MLNTQVALDLCYNAVMTALKLCAPVLVTAIVVGVAVNVVQTVTSIRDQTLAFVPKALAAVLVMGLTMPWAINIMNDYFEEMFMMFSIFSK